MLEEQLKRYWFFNKVGAYSININNPKTTIESINYTADVLNNKNNFVVYFPQGKIEDYYKRPPSIKKGIIKVVDRVKMPNAILPVIFKIVYSDSKQPDIFVRAGNKITITQGENFYKSFTEKFTETLNELDEYLLIGNERDLFIK
jgi:chlorobactene lauroyltransferase